MNAWQVCLIDNNSWSSSLDLYRKPPGVCFQNGFLFFIAGKCFLMNWLYIILYWSFLHAHLLLVLISRCFLPPLPNTSKEISHTHTYIYIFTWSTYKYIYTIYSIYIYTYTFMHTCISTPAGALFLHFSRFAGFTRQAAKGLSLVRRPTGLRCVFCLFWSWGANGRQGWCIFVFF